MMSIRRWFLTRTRHTGIVTREKDININIDLYTMIMFKITIPIRMPWNIKWAPNEKPLLFAQNILLTDLVFRNMNLQL